MNRKELEKLMAVPVMDDTEKAFRKWLVQNADALSNRSLLEVGSLARLVGFDAELVYRVVSPAAMKGQHIDNVASMAVFRETFYVEDPQKAGDVRMRESYLRGKFLVPLWKDYVANFVTGGDL